MSTARGKIIVVGKTEYISNLASHLENFNCCLVDSADKRFVSRANWRSLQSKLSARGKMYSGFVSLPSGFIPRNATLVAEFKDYIESSGLKIKTAFSLPTHLANIVDNKLLTYEYLSIFNQTANYIPYFLRVGLNSGRPNRWPVIFKNFYESGGRGNKLVRGIKSFNKLPRATGFVTEFLQGLEVTQTVLVLNHQVILLPQTWKNETTYSLTHSDLKPKFAGIFGESPEVVDAADRIINAFGGQYNYILSLQGVVPGIKNDTGFKLLELESRTTGSTPIMEEAAGISVYGILTKWFRGRRNVTTNPRIPVVACQFMSYSELAKDLRADYIIQIKPEYNVLLQKNRYRISFCSPNSSTLLESAHAIGKNINDIDFGNTVEQHLYEIKQHLG